MAGERLDVHLRIQRVICHDDGGVGRAEPYLLTAFFDIDGKEVRVADNLMLIGVPTFRAQDRPTHGNLGVKRLGSGETAQVPTRLGDYKTRLVLIPLPKGVARKKRPGIAGVVGVLYALLEFDTRADAAADLSHGEFNRQAKRTLTDAVRTARLADDRVTLDELRLDQFEASIPDLLRRLLFVTSGPFDNIVALYNDDDFIGANVHVFSHADLLDDPSQEFGTTFNRHGRWRVEGRVDATTP